MHDVRKALYRTELLDLHAAETADLPKIVSAEVNKHIMLGQLFLVGKQFGFQNLILVLGLSSRPCSRQRESMQDAVLQLDQRLRRSAGDLNVRPRKIEHIRRRIDGAQHPVCSEQTALKPGGKAV